MVGRAARPARSPRPPNDRGRAAPARRPARSSSRTARAMRRPTACRGRELPSSEAERARDASIAISVGARCHPTEGTAADRDVPHAARLRSGRRGRRSAQPAPKPMTSTLSLHTRDPTAEPPARRDPDEYLASLQRSPRRLAGRRRRPPQPPRGLPGGMQSDDGLVCPSLDTFLTRTTGSPLASRAASQKNHVAVPEQRLRGPRDGLGSVIGMPRAGRSSTWEDVRALALDDLALDVIGETFAAPTWRGSWRSTCRLAVITDRTQDHRPMRLADWLDEYRAIRPDSVERTVAEPVDDWQEPDLIVSHDRPRDVTPRWRERAQRVGYGRPSCL